jgi:hypothetical protein
MPLKPIKLADSGRARLRRGHARLPCRGECDQAGARLVYEKISRPFGFELKGTPAEYEAGLDCAIAKGGLVLHESGTIVRPTEAGVA